MVKNDAILLCREEENGDETYVVAVFEDVTQYTPCENYRKRRNVSVLNQKNIQSSWAEEYDPFFGWGKFSFGEFFGHGELMDAAWTTDGSGII